MTEATTSNVAPTVEDLAARISVLEAAGQSLTERVSVLEGVNHGLVHAVTQYAIALSLTSSDHAGRPRSELSQICNPHKLAPPGESADDALKRGAIVETLETLVATVYASLPKPR